jgi:plastocyanin
MKKIFSFAAAAAVIAAVVTACGGSSGSGDAAGTTDTASAAQSATASGQATTATTSAAITIENMTFGQPQTVAPGTEINIVNNDTAEHSVTSETDGVFDVHVDGGKRATLIAPTQPGEYAIYCVYHPNMKGTLIVK